MWWIRVSGCGGGGVEWLGMDGGGGGVVGLKSSGWMGKIGCGLGGEDCVGWVWLCRGCVVGWDGIEWLEWGG